MSFCTNCGNQIQEGMKFCPACGSPAPSPESINPRVSEPIQQPVQQPAQQEVPQYTPPVQPVQQPVQQEAPQYTPPVQPVQQPVQQEVPQYTAPVQEPIQQPVQQEVPQYTPPVQPVQQPIQQSQTEYTDDDLGKERILPDSSDVSKPTGSPDTEVGGSMESPPIVGNYSIPEVAKKSGSGINPAMITGIAAGAVVVIALIVCGIVFIPRLGGSPKVEGEGTALTDLLDNTAAYHYIGSQTGNDASVEEVKNVESEAEKTEDTGEATEATEAAAQILHAGWFYADFPAGMVTAKEGKEDWDEYHREDDHDVCIKVFEYSTKSKFPSALEQAKDDVAFYVENKGEDCGWYVGDDIIIGDYTWHTVHFPWNGENSSEKFYADVNDDYYVQVDCFMMDENSDDVVSFLKSFHLPEGDIGEMHLAWKQALWAEDE